MTVTEQIMKQGHRAALVLSKHSPKILVGVSIASGVAATGFAIWSTLHIDDILQTHQDKMASIAKEVQHLENDDAEVERKSVGRNKALVYVETGAALTKLYAPTIIFTGISIACVLSAHNILDKRYTAAAAAFATVSQQFEEYRGRVRAEVGEDKERDIYHGIKTEKVKGDDGKKHEERSYDNSLNNGISRYFDEFSPYWDKYNKDQNVAQIRAVLHHANDRLYADGHLFLNDVYRMLGIPDSKEGAVLGWILDADHENTYVDFGVYGPNSDDPWDEVRKEYWDGSTGILLDFNVDGIIYDKI